MRTVLILLFCAFAAAVACGAPPPVIRDTGVFENKDFAGDWVAYWLRGKKLAGKTETVFRLTPEGEWLIVLNGKAEKAGTFRATDKHLMLKPDRLPDTPPAEDGKKEDAASQPTELMAYLLDRNGFLIRAEGQPEIAIVYRRASSIAPVTQDDVKGEWKLCEESLDGEKRRYSEFGIVFDGAGNYTTVKYDRNARIPAGAEKGTYELKSDEVILRNDCREEGSLWPKMRFFKVFDELIVNTPNGVVFAEKQ